jgi:hypothetical protein
VSSGAGLLRYLFLQTLLKFQLSSWNWITTNIRTFIVLPVAGPIGDDDDNDEDDNVTILKDSVEKAGAEFKLIASSS